MLVRDEFIRPKHIEGWRLSHLLRYVPIHWWLLATLAIAIAVVGERSFRTVRKREDDTKGATKRISALEARLRPYFRVLDEHASKYMPIAASENQNPCEWHRVVFENIGVDTINNCKVTLLAVDGIQLPILPLELHQMNKPTDSTTPCVCQQHVEVAFDLFSYSYGADVAVWSNSFSPFLIKRPRSLRISISGDGVPTLWRTILVVGNDGEKLRTTVQEPDESDACI